MTMTVAATTPVAAARRVPTKITATPIPPRRGPMSIPILVRRRCASPDFSNTAPMNTKNGIARKVKLATVSANHLLNRRFIPERRRSPVRRPRAKKTMAVPAKEKATG